MLLNHDTGLKMNFMTLTMRLYFKNVYDKFNTFIGRI